MKSLEELARIDLVVGQPAILKYESGVIIDASTNDAKFMGAQFSPTGQLQIISFSSPLVKIEDKVLFEPTWGAYVIAVGENISQISP